MYVGTIELYNDGAGLGFGIVGVKDIGIVVKTILEGGTADKVIIWCGELRTHILNCRQLIVTITFQSQDINVRFYVSPNN